MDEYHLNEVDIKGFDILERWYNEKGQNEYCPLESVCKELDIDARRGRAFMALAINWGVINRVGDAHFSVNPEIVFKNRKVQNLAKEAMIPKDAVTQTWNYIRSRKILAIPLMAFLARTAILTLVASVATIMDKFGLIPKN